MEGQLSIPESESRNSTWLILGLGNPGPEYAGTFHNAGFRVVQGIAARLGIRMDVRFAGAMISGPVSLGGQPAVLVLPQTFMNRSGAVLPPLFERFETSIRRTLVVFDDLSLPLGKIRVRQKGSAGGHNGLKSLISIAGSDEFPRVRIGIDCGRPVEDIREFVLSCAGKEDRELLAAVEELAGRAVETMLVDGVEKAMAAYNGLDLRNAGDGPADAKPG
jgi:PTH1 family peptidyl-tRNA hydrolase